MMSGMTWSAPNNRCKSCHRSGAQPGWRIGKKDLWSCHQSERCPWGYLLSQQIARWRHQKERQPETASRSYQIKLTWCYNFNWFEACTTQSVEETVVLHHICVCTKFWLSPWYSNKVLMLQPLSLTALPVSASLLFKDRIPAESARAAAHQRYVSAKHCAICLAICYPLRNCPRFTGIWLA